VRWRPGCLAPVRDLPPELLWMGIESGGETTLPELVKALEREGARDTVRRIDLPAHSTWRGRTGKGEIARTACPQAKAG